MTGMVGVAGTVGTVGTAGRLLEAGAGHGEDTGDTSEMPGWGQLH